MIGGEGPDGGRMDSGGEVARAAWIRMRRRRLGGGDSSMASRASGGVKQLELAAPLCAEFFDGG